MGNQQNIRQVDLDAGRKGQNLILQHPFEFDGRKITSVFVRRMKGRDMRLLPTVGKDDSVPVDAMFPVCFALIDEPEDFIDEMDGSDINKLMEIVSSFVDDSSKKKQAGKRRGQR